jgi:hypothetical protein
MNYADFGLGTASKTGMFDSAHDGSLAVELGVNFQTNANMKIMMKISLSYCYWKKNCILM